MIVVGLTGGIGSGKSTVAALLAGHGAVIVDADRIARDIVAPGGAVHDAVKDRFGSAVVGPDGSVDRPALADVVFRDPTARVDLEAITHPAIQAEMARQVLEAEAGSVVVLDIPLLKQRRDPMVGVIVVDAPEEVAIERLVSQRQFDRQDAKRRIAAQIDRVERRRMADVLIDNSGDLTQLEREVDRAWAWALALQPAANPVSGGQ